ncbi:MAG: hypothetical protein RMJ88_16110 [Thermogemmata sp.]|nr:hypothetical protein [Thermogemmata sp.]
MKVLDRNGTRECQLQFVFIEVVGGPDGRCGQSRHDEPTLIVAKQRF